MALPRVMRRGLPHTVDRHTAGRHDAQPGTVCHDRQVRPTVLIVDDHPSFREAAAALLEADGFEVVGAAGDGPAALIAAARLRPQIVLLDVQLPGSDGFVVAEKLAAMPDRPAVVLVSSRDAGAYAARIAAAPVLGFIAKRDLSGPAVSALVGGD